MQKDFTAVPIEHPNSTRNQFTFLRSFIQIQSIHLKRKCCSAWFTNITIRAFSWRRWDNFSRRSSAVTNNLPPGYPPCLPTAPPTLNDLKLVACLLLQHRHARNQQHPSQCKTFDSKTFQHQVFQPKTPKILLTKYALDVT